MTELLYLASMDAAYERSFRARITSLPPGGIVLDRTAFYAVGGGQPADHGTLRRPDGAGWKVVDVTRTGPSALHRIDRPRAGSPLPAVGDEVEGSIDWLRRYLHMRCHTAQHLLSARVFALTGLRTRKAVIGHGGARIELEGPWPTSVSPDAVRDDLRDRIAGGLEVAVVFRPRAEYDRDPAPRSGLVPLAPTVDPVRLIQIDGSDQSPCGGTHVRNTHELGSVELAPARALADGGCELTFTLASDGRPTAVA